MLALICIDNNIPRDYSIYGVFSPQRVESISASWPS